MKNLFSFCFLCLIISGSVSGQQVDDKQWTVIHERTADWCPYCGTWGWNMKDLLINKFKDDKVIFMAVHHSGGLSNATSLELGENFSGLGQPRFYLEGIDLNANANNIDEKVNEAEIVVDYNSTISPYAGVGLEATFSETNDKTLTVNARVEFLTEVEGGDYYLGLYLLEDVIHHQASRSQNELHKGVLQMSLFPETFGKHLVTGAVPSGAVFNETVSISDLNKDRSKIKIVGVIWTKVNNKYIFFNANQVNVSIPAGTADNITENQMNIFQSESGNIIVDLDIQKEINQATLTLTDINGKILSSESIDYIRQGKQRLSISGNATPGVYLISLREGKNTVSKKIIIP
ncbi:MAG: T9SS type A sorting domain-containing protein [Saprospiraceae bacterium]|nr:T9SS type A sorting domain-containing protein [Saprospiraceae bacterium]